MQGALPADQAVGDEEAATPLEEEVQQLHLMKMETETAEILAETVAGPKIKEGRKSLLFLF